MKEGIVKNSIVFTGYQYNLKGELLPVPREFYSDRYFPPPPLRIESHAGELLSTIQFLPWQDGGTILLTGKFRWKACWFSSGIKHSTAAASSGRAPTFRCPTLSRSPGRTSTS